MSNDDEVKKLINQTFQQLDQMDDISEVDRNFVRDKGFEYVKRIKTAVAELMREKEYAENALSPGALLFALSVTFGDFFVTQSKVKQIPFEEGLIHLDGIILDLCQYIIDCYQNDNDPSSQTKH